VTFISPWTALIAGTAAVGLLVALYFLKLKRQEVQISSTLLWQRAVQDLQVNAPFQRLRRNILLLLQLLAVLAVLAALARPILQARGEGKRYVLLIDRSASMNATDVGGTSRLAEAKRQARVLIESMRSKMSFALDDRSDQAMVIAFDAHAKVLCNFTADKSQLLAAVDAIEPTDCRSSLAEAVTVAGAFATSAGEDANNRPAVEAAELVLFSDGRIGDLDAVVTDTDKVQFHCIGPAADEKIDNVAIVAMQARRSYERPDEVTVFAAVANFGSAPVKCDVQLSVDGNIRSIRPVEAPAMTGEGDKATPGKVSVTFTLTHPGSAGLEVRLLKRDSLSSDNAAWAILAPPRKLNVLLVTTGNPALEAALRACSLARLDQLTRIEFESTDLPALMAKRSYDLVVLDGRGSGAAEGAEPWLYDAAKLPRGQYLIFGPPGTGLAVTSQLKTGGDVIVDWQGRHPVLQHVDLSRLFISGGRRLKLPRDARTLAEFSDGPAMAVVRRRGSVFLLAGFDVMESNWPFEVGFVLFCYNSTRFLGMEIGQGENISTPVGSALTVQAAAGAAQGTEAELLGPGDLEATLKADSAGTFRYPKAARVGEYVVTAPNRTGERFAVNLLDPRESDIRPRGELVISGQQVQAQQGVRKANQDLWPLLAMIALALVCVEWWVYNSKVRI